MYFNNTRNSPFSVLMSWNNATLSSTGDFLSSIHLNSILWYLRAKPICNPSVQSLDITELCINDYNYTAVLVNCHQAPNRPTSGLPIANHITRVQWYVVARAHNTMFSVLHICWLAIMKFYLENSRLKQDVQFAHIPTRNVLLKQKTMILSSQKNTTIKQPRSRCSPKL